jgi:TonB-linked SusC/RagA family outer membrane protein
MGRLRYTFMERYSFSLSVRRDGSSVFGQESKWGSFPSVSMAWRINDEPLVKKYLPKLHISNLKLRLSYGVVGNQGIGPFQSVPLLNEYDMLFGDSNTYSVGLMSGNSLANPFLKWEQTASKNVGVDFGFFDNRISGSFEYYDTRTTDLLVYKKLPAVTGYSNQLTNIGEVQNEGIELQLSADLIKTKSFYWGINITYSRNRNMILQIDGQRDANGNLLDQPNNGWYIGHSIDAYREYDFAGIFNNIEEVRNSPQGKDPATGAVLTDSQLQAKVGSIRVNDVNNDGVITTADKKIFDATPKWIGSLSTTFKYKGFDLFLDFYTVQGVIKKNSYLYDDTYGGSNYGSANGIKVDYWTPDGKGQEAPLPSLSASDTYIKSLGLQDASYFRLRTISLGYTVPKGKWIDALSISRLNVYVSLTNYFTWTKYKSFGPETSPSSYPEAKIMNVGMNLSF